MGYLRFAIDFYCSGFGAFSESAPKVLYVPHAQSTGNPLKNLWVHCAAQFKSGLTKLFLQMLSKGNFFFIYFFIISFFVITRSIELHLS